ncbi:hypothetical protein EG829_22855, partial [bacterium]|nr:hypothetical protein [bacterium]
MARYLIRGILAVLAVFLTGCAAMDLYRSRLLDQADTNRPGVYINWLGTAGVLVSDGRTGILIDPY